ncbi:unnamed protein product [Nesidiocoris tenuis]|uniref:Uncharacterized protein n=1 Tax=Nesidiocoris tenuis TaxID=355587 RepID=A0A6H5GCP3_9HEMI|nr:unnamed protein product [Nesidiocoris tenuis]
MVEVQIQSIGPTWPRKLPNSPKKTPCASCRLLRRCRLLPNGGALCRADKTSVRPATLHRTVVLELAFCNVGPSAFLDDSLCSYISAKMHIYTISGTIPSTGCTVHSLFRVCHHKFKPSLMGLPEIPMKIPPRDRRTDMIQCVISVGRLLAMTSPGILFALILTIFLRPPNDTPLGKPEFEVVLGVPCRPQGETLNLLRQGSKSNNSSLFHHLQSAANVQLPSGRTSSADARARETRDDNYMDPFGVRRLLVPTFVWPDLFYGNDQYHPAEPSHNSLVPAGGREAQPAGLLGVTFPSWIGLSDDEFRLPEDGIAERLDLIFGGGPLERSTLRSPPPGSSVPALSPQLLRLLVQRQHQQVQPAIADAFTSVVKKKNANYRVSKSSFQTQVFSLNCGQLSYGRHGDPSDRRIAARQRSESRRLREEEHDPRRGSPPCERLPRSSGRDRGRRHKGRSPHRIGAPFRPFEPHPDQSGRPKRARASRDVAERQKFRRHSGTRDGSARRTHRRRSDAGNQRGQLLRLEYGRSLGARVDDVDDTVDNVIVNGRGSRLGADPRVDGLVVDVDIERASRLFPDGDDVGVDELLLFVVVGRVDVVIVVDRRRSRRASRPAERPLDFLLSRHLFVFVIPGCSP